MNAMEPAPVASPSIAELEQDIDTYFDNKRQQRRNLYELSRTADECNKCILAGKKHCWRKKLDYSGYYTQSYCCSPSDYQCRGLDFCSDQVSNQDLKLFTCPVEKASCPIGY